MIKFNLQSDHRLAVSSRDYTVYGGTMMDKSNSKEFAEKAVRIFKEAKKRPFAGLDLGCAGGNFVEQFHLLDEVCVGLEGADYSAARLRESWGRIPDYLFCCDITKPFKLVSQELQKHLGCNIEDCPPFRFDLITIWECLEHIYEHDLPQLFENIRAHLVQDAVVAVSVSSQPGFHHMTLQPRDWWLWFFDQQGFFVNEEYTRLFSNCWVRGPNEPASFNVALQQKKILGEWKV